MRWVSFEFEGRNCTGCLEGETIYCVPNRQLRELLPNLQAARALATEALNLSQVKLRQPILRPGKILGIGVNYVDHMKESVSFIENKAPEIQKWFNKQVTAANGPYDPVHVPKVSEQLDYEGELVAIIGQVGRHVPAERALELVAGFCCGCDYSVRDWQRASATMIMGKGFDTHAVFGPHLVTPDEVGDYRALTIETYVNEERRQLGRAADMRFSLEEQIAHLSRAFTLEPGDVIFTGTPAGVGAGLKPPVWLKPGDHVRVEIDGLGQLDNPIITEPDSTVRLGA